MRTARIVRALVLAERVAERILSSGGHCPESFARHLSEAIEAAAGGGFRDDDAGSNDPCDEYVGGWFGGEPGGGVQ
jgi:hypothetical protein